MTDYENLVKRLRNGLPCYGEKCLSCPDRKHCTTHYDHEAADAIEELSYKYQKALGDLVKQPEQPEEET